MELEEKWHAGLQRAKHSRPAGLPEIDLVRIDSIQELNPVLVRDTDPDFHTLSMSAILGYGCSECRKEVRVAGQSTFI